MEVIGNPKTSVRNYHSFTLRKISEERNLIYIAAEACYQQVLKFFQRLVNFFLYIYFQPRTDKISLGATALGKRLLY
jgi:hypothetical protein